MSKKLYKSNDRVLCGVLGGFGEYFNVDPNIVRLIFIGILLFTWFVPMTIFYIIAAIIMPTRPSHRTGKNYDYDIKDGDYRD